MARKADHFRGVSADAKNVLLTRFFTLLDWLGADAPKQSLLNSILRSQNIDRSGVGAPTIALEDAKTKLRRTIGTLPIANALAVAFSKDHKLADIHNLLAVWVILAVLRERWIDTKDATPHGPALRAVRLLQAEKKNHAALAQLVPTSRTIENVIDQLTALCDRSSLAPTLTRHLNNILVVLTRMDDGRNPYHPDRSDLPLLKYRSELVDALTLLAPDEADDRVRLIKTHVYVEEDGETEPSSPDIPSHSDLVLANPAVDRVRRADPDYRRRFSRGAAHALHMRTSRAKSLWGGLTAAERNHVVATCLKRISPPFDTDTFFYLEFLLVLLFGRAIDELRGMEILPLDHGSPAHLSWWSTEHDDIHLCFWPALPSKRSRSSYRDLLLAIEIIPLKLRVPAALQALTRDYISSMHRRMPDEHRTRLLWETIWDGWSRRPALGRLPDELFHSLMARKRDSASASHVIGQAAKHNPALYYTTIECAELTEVHSDIAVRLIGHDNSPDHPGGHVGSRLIAERGILHRLFPACRDFLADARRQRDFDTFAFHNRYVAITFLTLSLFTAHRPVRAPFQNIQDFDLTADWLFIDDKEVRQTGASRVVPLTYMAKRQLAAYCTHLKAMAARVDDPNGMVAQAIRQALQGDGFLLFFLELDGPAIVTPGKLKRLLSDVFPLPLNWARHFWRTALRGQVSDELMNALMGHVELNGPTFGEGSTISLHNLEPLRIAMNSELDRLGAFALPGLTT